MKRQTERVATVLKFELLRRIVDFRPVGGPLVEYRGRRVGKARDFVAEGPARILGWDNPETYRPPGEAGNE